MLMRMKKERGRVREKKKEWRDGKLERVGLYYIWICPQNCVLVVIHSPYVLVVLYDLISDIFMMKP